MVVTVEKNASASKCEDFRPINMLSTFEEILESVVKEQLLKHIVALATKRRIPKNECMPFDIEFRQ